MGDLQNNIQPGWDCKIDLKTGRQYYINHYTKTTTWEDPRNRLRHGTPLHISNGHHEYIPLQHGSPDLKRNSIYPSHPSPIPAFQMPGQYIPLQEIKSSAHMSPLSVRTPRIQDTTFSSSQDPDESVAKISSMFPTVSDTHIRLLLKKYHNREAVVISALQVEKHPIVTLGPFATPPPNRSVHVPLQMTPPLGVRTVSRTSSPILRTYSGTNSTYTGSPRIGDGYRTSTPRPHSSPKLKLRYMKSIFPEVDETMILDILASNENNIQKASDSLKQMGFTRTDPAKLKLEAEAKAKEEERKNQEEIDKVDSPPPLPKIKTTQEKEVIKESLQNHYKDIPEHVIVMALDSVDYSEETAIQILEIMVKGESKMKENGAKVEEVLEEKAEENVELLTVPNSVPASQSRQSLKSLLKEKAENPKTTFSREDYVKWQGPNPKLISGCDKGLAKGPNKSLLSKGSYKACGPNPDMHKGPIFGLAKGSIFSQLKHVLGESRGQ